MGRKGEGGRNVCRSCSSLQLCEKRVAWLDFGTLGGWLPQMSLKDLAAARAERPTATAMPTLPQVQQPLPDSLPQQDVQHLDSSSGMV